MTVDELIMICISDFAGLVRGKGVPESWFERRCATGIGLAPSNLMITAFGEIVNTPWGPRGELLMMPDPATEVRIAGAGPVPATRFVLADLVDLDGAPWDCCPRNWARRGLDGLHEAAGLTVISAFEHEFHYSGAEQRLGDAYALDSVRSLDGFPEQLFAALSENRIEAESFLPEYGPGQFEVTCRPNTGLASADTAVRLREITRTVAQMRGHRASFAPIRAPGAVGNGVHIHFSLADGDGHPVGYDPASEHGIAPIAGSFVAGVLRHMPALVALTAPSAVSYQRLQPNHWSASYNNFGDLDREAGVRLCPIARLPGSDPQAAFNFEYRAADATACPYFALGALVWAGLEGIREGLPTPEPISEDPQAMSAEQRNRRGLVRLPQSLPEALTALADDSAAQRWLGPALGQAYRIHKDSELALVDGVSVEEQCKRYGEIY